MAENPVLNERYRLVEQIGAGGMAVIYRGQDLELERNVAIKVLRPSLVSDPDFLRRFRKEARSAARLNHPNIVTVHDVGQDGPNTHFIVMEMVEGQNLKQLLRTVNHLDVDAALAVIIEVCKGVGYAHRNDLVHCDIKPQNILVTPDNMIKVADFGIARAMAEAEDHQGLVWGSPHYFAPEQAAGQAPTPPSDVYSIGVVLFELLTGRLPFTGTDYQQLALAHLQEPAPSILAYEPALPGELDRIISKVLSKEPSQRYRSADQFGNILKTYRDKGRFATGSFRVHESLGKLPPVQAPAPEIELTQPHGYDAPPLSQPQQQRTPTGPVTGVPAYPEQQARPDYTVPSLPPINPNEVIGRIRGGDQRAAPAAAPNPGRAAIPSRRAPAPADEAEDVVPGVDIENIVLGILASVAVLGLIPLWVVVFLTFTR